MKKTNESKNESYKESNKDKFNNESHKGGFNKANTKANNDFNRKRNWLLSIILIYAIIASIFAVLIAAGIMQKAPPSIASAEGSDSIPEIPENSIAQPLKAAQDFLEKNMVEKNGHVDLYIEVGNKNNSAAGNNSAGNYGIDNNISVNDSISDMDTNSEAASYYLLWTAQQADKERFDNELQFVKTYMIYPKFGYMMWRLTPNDSVIGDGSNIATDADLRTIKALLIAEKEWHDSNYTDMIGQLAGGIEKVAITKDGYLAPYGGVSGQTSTWTANEVWLSYTDFTVLNELSNRFGPPWTAVYANMKKASLNAQLANGLYNSMLTESRQYGNGIDAGGYSINSMWMMVRNAESSDKELMQSANKSLQFYKSKFQIDGELYATYGSNGDALSPADTPWVYALVGRAAIALGDKDFSGSMMRKLMEKQVNDTSSQYFGAFPEDYMNGTRVGQFTMQESILSMQAFNELNKK